uniref:Uncharacterized protein n=1 Tax=Magallana gigas TaxID=29159 RepID=K1Q1V3_MAGGI
MVLEESSLFEVTDRKLYKNIKSDGTRNTEINLRKYKASVEHFDIHIKEFSSGILILEFMT